MSGLILLPANELHGSPIDVKTERWQHVGEKGDLRVELHYGNFIDQHTRECALYVCHKSNPTRGVFVPLRMMWAWNEFSQARSMMATAVYQMAERIWGFVTSDDCYRLLDTVLDYLEDLKNSPPPPQMRCDSLDYFLERVERETDGGSFFVEVGGEPVLGNPTTH